MSSTLDKWHLTARNSFVPFCVAFFNDDRLSVSGDLPGDNKDALDKESLTALEGVLREILLQKLIEMGGWKKVEIFYEGQQQSKRLWEIDFSIVLSSRIIQWLIFIHNSEWSKAACIEPSTPGDMIFYDLVFSQSARKRRFKIDSSIFDRSHLTSLLNLKSADAETLKEISFLLPWLESSVISRWYSSYELCWKSRKSFTDSIKTQTALFKSILKKDDPALFSLLCQWFATITGHGLNRERLSLENFKSELSYLKDRQQLTELWLNNILLVEELFLKYEACTNVHPIDRTELDRYYLHIWGKKNMNRVRDVILSIKADSNQLLAGE